VPILRAAVALLLSVPLVRVATSNFALNSEWLVLSASSRPKDAARVPIRVPRNRTITYNLLLTREAQCFRIGRSSTRTGFVTTPR
jgi:hypothetical protein